MKRHSEDIIFYAHEYRINKKYFIKLDDAQKEEISSYSKYKLLNSINSIKYKNFIIDLYNENSFYCFILDFSYAFYFKDKKE